MEQADAQLPVALVLDDDDGVREVVAQGLRAEAYWVIECRSGADFHAALDRHAVDVYLLDVCLPDGNGLQIARELRRATDAGIILLTGQGDETDHVLGLELGADDYVTKPFRIRELRARVNAVMRRCRRSRGEAQAAGPDAPPPVERLRAQGLEIMPAARTVRGSDGEAVPLTTLEFDVLVALARQPDRVLSREQIMDHVRGPGWAAYDRAVDGLISRLRLKLFPDGSGAERIKTVRGVGYMLASESG